MGKAHTAAKLSDQRGLEISREMGPNYTRLCTGPGHSKGLLGTNWRISLFPALNAVRTLHRQFELHNQPIPSLHRITSFDIQNLSGNAANSAAQRTAKTRKGRARSGCRRAPSPENKKITESQLGLC